MGFEFESVIVVARDGLGRSNNEPVGVGDGQNIGRFGPFASLISHGLAAFLGDGM